MSCDVSVLWGDDMPIPKYYEMYRTFLEILQDSQDHELSEIKKSITMKMSITEDEMSLVLPSGKQKIFDNRIGWARTYLKKAGLIESHSRGVFNITSEGASLLSNYIGEITDDYLMKYDSFKEFKKPALINGTSKVDLVEIDEKTPEEVMDGAFSSIHKKLSDELLSEIMKQTPAFFEYLVVELLNKMGYGGQIEGSGNVVGKSGDEGIDGIIREDKLGFNNIYIQAKRWGLDSTIGRPEIQKFVGAVSGQGGSRGLFITTGKFSKEALEFSNKHLATKIILVDGTRLADLMIEHCLGVSVQNKYEIKRIDTDYFSSDN
ncbi:restriction endonuclease [Youngiibacter multivorans]|uniref:Restriction system protein n=1 Tax=Youngiibacter multivorans TaxID=937251 RepID=A0ABS4G6X8_9CLOT|nr:restriction endonuclease [Youngiibacter multivorans]MBP1920286.1 restriction system protein [Youngiibacter multivorans]